MTNLNDAEIEVLVPEEPAPEGNKSQEDQVDRAKPSDLKTGDFVSWNSSGGRARGKITSVIESGKYDVPDSSVSIEATSDDPVAAINVYRETDEGWEASDVTVGHKFSALTKISELRELDLQKKFCRMESTVFSELDERTFEFPFSSEAVAKRYFGDEVLSHEPGHCDLSRLNNAAPLLFNHNPDKQIGVVERGYIDYEKKRGYCRVRFSSNPFAQEVMRDVKEGILRGVSVGYSIDNMEEKDGLYRCHWTPYEVSMAVLPLDPSVGIGRSLAIESAATAASPANPETEVQMDNTPDIEVIRSEAAQAERSRISSITALGEKFDMSDLAEELITGGRDLNEAREAILQKLTIRSNVTETTAPQQSPEIGLTKAEVKNFSFARALNALANPGDKNAWEGAAFEREVSEATSKAYNKPAAGFLVPNEVLTRDLTVGVAADGGNLVDEVLLAGSFIEILRNRSAIMQAGVTMLDGLQGNVAIPRQLTSANSYWVGEGSAPAESQQSFDQIQLSPKTVGAFVDYSRRLLLQSSIGVEQMIRDDLAKAIALELDRAAIYGTGSSNQPLGLTQTSGIGSQTLTSYGTFAELIGMETDVATANADVAGMRYIVNAAARGALKSTSLAGTEARFVYENNEINGYPAIVSNQLLNNDILFGDFSQFIVGMWSGLDLTIDPYAGATKGDVRVIAMQDVDYAVKQPAAFCFAS